MFSSVVALTIGCSCFSKSIRSNLASWSGLSVPSLVAGESSRSRFAGELRPGVADAEPVSSGDAVEIGESTGVVAEYCASSAARRFRFSSRKVSGSG